MPKQKETRPTNIYWLYDTRPETVAVFGPEGQPFYCGKTVLSANQRLCGHRGDAKRYPRRPLSVSLVKIGKPVRTQVVEIVSSENDWRVQECFWIAKLRLLNPNCVNVSAGGHGVTGAIRSAEVRAKVSASLKGRVVSAETRAKISASTKGRIVSEATRAKMRGATRSPELRAKISAKLTGRKVSEETRAKIAAFRESHPMSEETRAKLSAASKRLSLEARAKIGAAHRGKIVSTETRAKTSAALKGRLHSPETRARLSAALKGRPISAERRLKMESIWASPEYRAKISAGRRVKLSDTGTPEGS